MPAAPMRRRSAGAATRSACDRTSVTTTGEAAPPCNGGWPDFSASAETGFQPAQPREAGRSSGICRARRRARKAPATPRNSTVAARTQSHACHPAFAPLAMTGTPATAAAPAKVPVAGSLRTIVCTGSPRETESAIRADAGSSGASSAAAAAACLARGTLRSSRRTPPTSWRVRGTVRLSPDPTPPRGPTWLAAGSPADSNEWVAGDATGASTDRTDACLPEAMSIGPVNPQALTAATVSDASNHGFARARRRIRMSSLAWEHFMDRHDRVWLRVSMVDVVGPDSRDTQAGQPCPGPDASLMATRGRCAAHGRATE